VCFLWVPSKTRHLGEREREREGWERKRSSRDERGVVDALSLSINDTVLQRRELICVFMCVCFCLFYTVYKVFLYRSSMTASCFWGEIRKERRERERDREEIE